MKTTLDDIVACLDALHQQDYGGDTELDDGDRRGRAPLYPATPVTILLPRLNSEFHLLMANMILLCILIGN